MCVFNTWRPSGRLMFSVTPRERAATVKGSCVFVYALALYREYAHSFSTSYLFGVYRSEVKARQDVKPDIRQPPFTDYRQPPVDYRHPPVADYRQPPTLDYRHPPPLIDYRQHSTTLAAQFPLAQFPPDFRPQVRLHIPEGITAVHTICTTTYSRIP